MRSLPAALLAVGLLAPAACGPATDSALGREPTTYPAAGRHRAAASEGSPEAVLIARASTAVEAALSYDHETYAADTAAATALMTPAFAASWSRIAQRLRPRSDERQAQASARVVAAGVTGATTRSAQVLLFVDRTLRSSKGRQASGSYAVATLRQQAGSWRLAGLGLTPPPRQITEQRPVPATVLAATTAVADAYADVDSAHAQADVARLLSLTTGPFHRDYERASSALVSRVVAARAAQEGTVVAAGLTSVSDDSARAVAVVTTVLRVPGDAPVRRLLRLELELVRTDTAWLARDLRLVPEP